MKDLHNRKIIMNALNQICLFLFIPQKLCAHQTATNIFFWWHQHKLAYIQQLVVTLQPDIGWDTSSQYFSIATQSQHALSIYKLFVQWNIWRVAFIFAITEDTRNMGDFPCVFLKYLSKSTQTVGPPTHLFLFHPYCFYQNPFLYASMFLLFILVQRYWREEAGMLVLRIDEMRGYFWHARELNSKVKSAPLT